MNTNQLRGTSAAHAPRWHTDGGADLRIFEERLRHHVEFWAKNREWDFRQYILFTCASLIAFLMTTSFVWWMDLFKHPETTLIEWLLHHYFISAGLLCASISCGLATTTRHPLRPSLDIGHCRETLSHFNLRCDADGRLILPSPYARSR
eukprot:m.147667 g.147667  ORF g.147667 m.147667 type:complete len:149 (-) comp9711_c0_seq1:470-916(-)